MNLSQLAEALAVPVEIGSKIVQPYLVASHLVQAVLDDAPPQQAQEFGSVTLLQASNPTSWMMRCKVQSTDFLLVAGDLEMQEAVMLAKHFATLLESAP